MNVKTEIKKWKEPWKKKELGARLSKRALKDGKIMDQQRSKMKKAATQKIVFVCHKQLAFPGLYKKFTVIAKIPLRKEEIDERMRAAFPELDWEES